MGDRNAYFQIMDKDDGTYLKLFPAQGEGAPIKADELLRYVSRQKVEIVNTHEMIAVIKNYKEETEVKLNSKSSLPISEEMEIDVELDKMTVIGRFYPASSKGKLIDKNEIVNTLKLKGIIFGIQDDVIEEFLKNRRYCEDFVLAKGRPVIQGRDGKINYHFNLNLESKPKLNEDGSVNFHLLDNINRVNKGDVLATLVPEISGNNGKDVFGKEILAKKIEKKRLKYGRNISISEDNLQLISEINGHVELDYESKIVVYNIFEVAGDVDASTGDIKYSGKVFVKGNVRTGFAVEADDDIEVNGVVEGAKIISGGQITLRRGIQGMNRGILEAKGNIVAKFIENAKVIAGGMIETDCILHSTVSAHDEIVLKGRRGLIVGGNVRSAKLIEAQNVGSEMGTTTIVEVGGDPNQQDYLAKLQEEEKVLREEEYRVRQIVDLLKAKQEKGQLSQDKISEFKKILERYVEVYKRLKEIAVEVTKANQLLTGETDARIKVFKNVYPGVKIVIGGEVLITRDIRSFSQFVKDRGEVKVLTL